MTLSEIRLPRETCSLGSVHTAIPHGAIILRIRYTKTEMVILYRK